MAIINYYKLVYVEKLSYDKDIDTFIMLGGKSLVNRLKNDSDNRYIDLDKTNFGIISRLNNKTNQYVSRYISSTTNIKEELTHLGWLNEVIESIDEGEKLYDTIVNNANINVYGSIIEPTFTEKITNYYKDCIMKKKVKSILNKNMSVE